MNRVGEAGQGTSVWLGWLLIATIRAILPLAEPRDPARAARWRDHAESVRLAIEQDAWDGAWYHRGRFDDGSVLGSSASEECQIDSIAQSWAVLSGGADPERAAIAMQSVMDHLIKPDVALLFTPPLGHPASVANAGWPTHDEALLVQDTVTAVVQVQGKVRDRLEVSPGISEDELRELALASENVQRALDGRGIRTVIVRAPKLVNIVPA